MTQTLGIPAGPVGKADHHRPFGLFKELERPSDVFRDLGPNWFAAVMGTGIVAIAGAVLPLRLPGLRVFATVVWALAAAALIALILAWGVHWVRYPERARGHAANPVMAQFWGAPAMALMMKRDNIGPGDAFGGWLMPVVPPMVSAATGALLIPHVASAQGWLTLLLACYAMFGISLFASVIIITQIWSRLVTYKPGPAVMVPTMWIVLGPLGQSVTAAGNPGTEAGPLLSSSARC